MGSSRILKFMSFNEMVKTRFLLRHKKITAYNERRAEINFFLQIIAQSAKSKNVEALRQACSSDEKLGTGIERVYNCSAVSRFGAPSYCLFINASLERVFTPKFSAALASLPSSVTTTLPFFFASAR